MQKRIVRKDEQIKLIMECRQSGLSDYQWCRLSIPALIEPPVRSLGATLPAAQSHPSGGGNHHSGN